MPNVKITTLSIISDSLYYIDLLGIKFDKNAGLRQNALLDFIPSNPPGAFRLKGVATNLYLAMDKKGMLYGEADYEDDNTLFAEHAHVSEKLCLVSRISTHSVCPLVSSHVNLLRHL